jgi:[acyl-carrier-protein] S-malonyltransferase
MGALEVRPIPAAAAYHSPRMSSAARRFGEVLRAVRLREPAIPVYSYHRLEKVATAAELKDTMATQLAARVRWVELVRRLAEDGRQRWLEVGPGTVISRTVRWIDRSIDIHHTAASKSLSAALLALGV